LAAQLNQPAGAVEEVEHNAAAERIKAFLAQRRSEAARLNAVRPQADELRQAVVAAQAEVQRAAAQAATFRELRDAEYHDLVVIQRASPAFGAATSNKKKLIAGAAAVGFLGCLAPIALLDLLTRRKRGVDSTAELARLPEIAPADPAGDDHSQQVRTLALRIQQSARVDGSISVFSALDDAAAPAELVAATAQCLALRGESVLVIDTTPEVGVAPSLAGQLVARPQVDPAVAVFNDWTGARPEAVSLPATAPDRSGSGLAALLRDGELAAVDALRPGRHFDVLPVGDARLPAEAFASRRLSDVLAELRRRYSTILLIGPDASHAVDLEMLAARASSLVFVARRRGRPTPVALQTIDSLRAVSAPILGLVSV
jgi:Mrp family chromosome partitioning ATPase